MIIVKLMGGLGNQMFQYAAARSLSLLHDTELKMDLSFMESDQVGSTPRTFELCHFNINAGKASPQEINLMNGGEVFVRNKFLSSYFKKIDNYGRYGEKNFNFDPKFFSLPDNILLDGYWQSERYFVKYIDIIRKEFTLGTHPSGRNLEIAEEIRAVNAVSVHVRRGDYVTNEKIRAIHYVCDLEYYLKAVENITQSVEEPHFFVFSDDPEWVAANLKLRYPMRIVSNNTGMGFEDLRLMSLCRHNIIANSSFSWWGAWLNANQSKLVCAPARWFNQFEAKIDDRIPQMWRKIY